MDDLELRRWRLQGARFLIRAELAVAIIALLIAAFWYVAAPGASMPMFWKPPLLVALAPWAGGIGLVVGIAWMVRLSRPDPEPGERSWRYRDF